MRPLPQLSLPAPRLHKYGARHTDAKCSGGALEVRVIVYQHLLDLRRELLHGIAEDGHLTGGQAGWSQQRVRVAWSA